MLMLYVVIHPYIFLVKYHLGQNGLPYYPQISRGTNFHAKDVRENSNCAKKTIFAQEGKNNRPKTKNYIADARGVRKIKLQKLKPRK